MIVGMLIAFLLLMLVGVPVSFATAIACTGYILLNPMIPEVVIAQRMFVASDSFSLMAIPLFILAGELMNSGGITRKIVHLSSALVGHIRGGLAHITILASMMFAGMSGSSAAASASVGAMMIPAMKEEGYDPEFAASVTACGAVIGPIIPPSISMVMYGSITGYSTGKLFLGGIIPGCIIGVLLMIVAYFGARKRGYLPKQMASPREIAVALRGSLAALAMPMIIIGGIMSGVFTATEAGVVGAVYGMIVGLVSKETQFRDFPRIFLNAAKTTSVIMFIISSAMLLGWILTQAQIPQLLIGLLTSFSDNSLTIFFLILFMLFVLGCFMIDAAIIPLCTPLFIPIIKQYGIDPIHFGVVMCMMTTTGGVTPPVGNLLFIACGISKVPVTRAIKTLIPFLIALLVSIIICTLVPVSVTLIPNLVMG